MRTVAVVLGGLMALVFPAVAAERSPVILVTRMLEPAKVRVVGRYGGGGMLYSEGVHGITLSLLNDGSKALDSVRVRIRLMSGVRKVPLVESVKWLRIVGGLEPGEQRSLTWEVAKWMLVAPDRGVGDTDWLEVLDFETLKLGEKDEDRERKGTCSYREGVRLEVEVVEAHEYEGGE